MGPGKMGIVKIVPARSYTTQGAVFVAVLNDRSTDSGARHVPICCQRQIEAHGRAKARRAFQQ